MAISDYRLAHEVPKRLRFQIPALGKPGFHASVLDSWRKTAGPVTAVGANCAARTLIVRYQGGDEARSAVIRRLENFSQEEFSGYGEEGDREAEVTPLITTALALVALPFLTPRV